MNFKILSITVGISVLVFFLNLSANAQFNERVRETLGRKNSAATGSLIARLVQNQPRKSAKPGAVASPAVKFKPVADSGVARTLAEAFGAEGDAKQKEELTEAFRQIMQGYEAEVAKDGKSNNLAAAMTFFIAANVATYGQTDLASEEAGEKLFQSLQEAMAGVPAFAEMTDAEKHRMHDWLVCMGGFALMNYEDAKQSGDKEALANIKTFADYSIRLVLGIEASKLNFSPAGLTIQDQTSNSVTNPQSVDKRISGTWSRKTAVANSNMITNAGYFVSRYNFNTDGTYTFKSEMWNGYLRSEEWWTTEESGTFSVGGNTLTISPTRSVSAARNRAGALQKTQNNPLEKVTYNWKLHFYEGINETVLILQPSAQTKRDGVFGGDSNFPNSYIFDQTSVIEWKF